MESQFNIDDIIGFDALYESMNKCRKGVMWKDSVAAYCMNGIERTLKLSQELKEGEYKARPPISGKTSAPMDTARCCVATIASISNSAQRWTDSRTNAQT